MNRGETIFLDHALGNEDGVLKVIAIPGHECDQQVLPQRQFAHIGGRAIGQYVSLGNLVARLDQRLLVDTGVLV